MKFRVFANLFLIVCCVVAIYAISVKTTKPKSKDDSSSLTTDLKERDLAIQKANDTGSSTYSFTTGFTPGVGYPSAASSK